MNSKPKVTGKIEEEKLRLAKQERVAEETKLASVEERNKNAEVILKDNVQLMRTQEQAHKKWLKDAQDEAKAVRSKLQAVKADYKELQEQVKERKRYQKDQEEAIAAVIENGNVKIRQLHADIAGIDRQKEEALTELADALEQKQLETIKVSEVQERLRALKELYEETAARLRVELRELQTNIKQAQMNHQHIIRQTPEVLRKLAAKEAELQVREQVLDERDEKQAEEAEYLRKKRAYIKNN